MIDALVCCFEMHGFEVSVHPGFLTIRREYPNGAIGGYDWAIPRSDLRNCANCKVRDFLFEEAGYIMKQMNEAAPYHALHQECSPGPGSSQIQT